MYHRKITDTQFYWL